MLAEVVSNVARRAAESVLVSAAAAPLPRNGQVRLLFRLPLTQSAMDAAVVSGVMYDGVPGSVCIISESTVALDDATPWRRGDAALAPLFVPPLVAALAHHYMQTPMVARLEPAAEFLALCEQHLEGGNQTPGMTPAIVGPSAALWAWTHSWARVIADQVGIATLCNGGLSAGVAARMHSRMPAYAQYGRPTRRFLWQNVPRDAIQCDIMASVPRARLEQVQSRINALMADPATQYRLFVIALPALPGNTPRMLLLALAVGTMHISALAYALDVHSTTTVDGVVAEITSLDALLTAAHRATEYVPRTPDDDFMHLAPVERPRRIWVVVDSPRVRLWPALVPAALVRASAFISKAAGNAGVGLRELIENMPLSMDGPAVCEGPAAATAYRRLFLQLCASPSVHTPPATFTAGLAVDSVVGTLVEQV